MLVSGYLRCLRHDHGEILWAGGPLDQRGWKISKLWLPWQPLPWQPKNLPRAHKTPKRLWVSNRRGIGWEENCCHDFILPWQPLSFHGNPKNARAPLPCTRIHDRVPLPSQSMPLTLENVMCSDARYAKSCKFLALFGCNNTSSPRC